MGIMVDVEDVNFILNVILKGAPAEFEMRQVFISFMRHFLKLPLAKCTLRQITKFACKEFSRCVVCGLMKYLIK